MPNWTHSDIPNQVGHLAVVTGTGGLGYETALALARAGADVVIAGREPKKGAIAVANIKAAVSTARVRFEQVDLASLDSIAEFGERMRGRYSSLDVLINNAGVMVPPVRRETIDGFELQLGTNYLGHFALTAHLMPLLGKAKLARVVTLSSLAARQGAINFDDLNARQSYKPMPVYSQSKLACLMFAFELHRRCGAGGSNLRSIAAHPGLSRTDLLHNGPGRRSLPGLARTYLWFLFQPTAQGALPALFAATAPQAEPGGYYGPNKMGETRGYPVEASVPQPAIDRVAAERLWRISEQMTSINFRIASPVSAPALFAAS
jgi:NAD(P)-dependent dehydrogenase (short-subunit alcohol dehydrogenase family)